MAMLRIHQVCFEAGHVTAGLFRTRLALATAVREAEPAESLVSADV